MERSALAMSLPRFHGKTQVKISHLTNGDVILIVFIVGKNHLRADTVFRQLYGVWEMTGQLLTSS